MSERIELLTTDEVAAFLKCSKRSVLRLPIPAIKVGRRLRRYDPKAVADYLCHVQAAKQLSPL